jgi:hypothetical protein
MVGYGQKSCLRVGTLDGVDGRGPVAACCFAAMLATNQRIKRVTNSR